MLYGKHVRPCTCVPVMAWWDCIIGSGFRCLASLPFVAFWLLAGRPSQSWPFLNSLFICTIYDLIRLCELVCTGVIFSTSFLIICCYICSFFIYVQRLSSTVITTFSRVQTTSIYNPQISNAIRFSLFRYVRFYVWVVQLLCVWDVAVQVWWAKVKLAVG